MKKLSQEVQEYYNRVAPYYDSLYKDIESQLENRIVSKDLRKICNGKSVLDLGCGTGLSLLLCNPKEYMGLDISTKMVDVAKMKFGKDPTRQFIIGDLNNGSFEDNIGKRKFDVIISLFSPLSHIPDIENVLEESKKALNKEGQVYLMLYGRKPFHNFISKYNIRNSIPGEGILAYFYRKAELTELLSGWGNVRIRGLDSFKMLRFGLERLDNLVGRLIPIFSHTLIVQAEKIGR